MVQTKRKWDFKMKLNNNATIMSKGNLHFTGRSFSILLHDRRAVHFKVMSNPKLKNIMTIFFYFG